MNTPPPDALLFISPACPHCPAMLASLAQLLKEGLLGKLEAINLAAHPEATAELGVKSVPWLRLGPFELEGAQTPAELRSLALGADDAGVMASYIHDLLISGRRARVEDLLRREPRHFGAFPRLLRDPATSMAVRIGIGAVLEEFQGSGLASGIIPALGEILRDAEPRTRADAAHFLSLIGGPEALAIFRAHLDDADPEVREIAAEALQESAA
ncbi:MAG: HEAT repeat domain-containing protein [Sulfuricella sp.]|nr:HEAT repeat domain-containing protein [Sulfuricella sp.]